MNPCISSFDVQSEQMPKSKNLSLPSARTLRRMAIENETILEPSTIVEDVRAQLDAELSSQNYSVTVTNLSTELYESSEHDVVDRDSRHIPGDISECPVRDRNAKSVFLLDMSVIKKDTNHTLCRHITDNEFGFDIPLHSSLLYPQCSTPSAPQNIAFVDTTVLPIDNNDIETSVAESNAHLHEKEVVLNHMKNVIHRKSSAVSTEPAENTAIPDTTSPKRLQRRKLRVHELRRLAHRYEHQRLKARYCEQHPFLENGINVVPTKVERWSRSSYPSVRSRNSLSELGNRPPCVGEEAPQPFKDAARVCVPTDNRLHRNIIPAKGKPHRSRFMRNVNKQILYDNVLGVL